jgi:7-cyano-7-deazaguanine synthase
MTSTKGRAVVLLSGGLDSSTTLAWAKAQGYECYALSFDYQQRHRRELQAAQATARALGAKEHLLIRFDLRGIGGSALTTQEPVPKGQAPREGIPPTYVPARNTIFLAFALAWAEVLGAEDIFIGANAVDYSGYPDCRPQFLEAFQHLANLATREAVQGRMHFRVQAPLLSLSKADIIRKAVELGLDLALTWSCYDPTPEGRPCGACDSCLFRAKGFREAGLQDPLLQK